MRLRGPFSRPSWRSTLGASPSASYLLELLDDRYDAGSTIITSQLEPKDWHAVIGDPTLADAICDRLVHNAHRLKLGEAESIRKTVANLTTKPKQSK